MAETADALKASFKREIQNLTAEILTEADTMDKQLIAFEKLTTHAVSRFSIQHLWKLLLRLDDLPFPQTPRRVGLNGGLTSRSSSNLNSIALLREHLSRLKKRERRSALDNQTVQACETFLRDVQYMRQVKNYFEEKIYCPLYRYFYDPSDVAESEDAQHSTTNIPSTFFLTETHEDAPKDANYGINVEHLSDAKKLEYAVQELYNINKRWDKLFYSEDVIPIEDFEPDSAVEVNNLTNQTNDAEETSRSALLRLLPDIFVKCTKSIELARLWWRLASSIYKIPQGERLDGTRYRSRVHSLKQEMATKQTALHQMEHRLNIASQEVDFLLTREKRITQLSKSCDKMKKHQEELGQHYKSSIQQRSEMLKERDNTVQGTQRYTELCNKLHQLEATLQNEYKELKFVEYTLGINESDYAVELEVSPSFVHFTEAAQQKIEILRKEQELVEMERRRLERRLVLVKTNYDRMTEILVRVHGSEAITMDDPLKQLCNRTYTIERSEPILLAISSAPKSDEKVTSDVVLIKRQTPQRILHHSQPLDSTLTQFTQKANSKQNH